MQPEILNDSFSKKLCSLAYRSDVSTILEIGAGSGNGSTMALSAGIRSGRTDQTLWCLEADPKRFAELQTNVKGLPGVRPLWGSSVIRGGLPSWEKVEAWWRKNPGHLLQNYGLEAVREWHRCDEEGFRTERPEGLISDIMGKEGLAYFDLVLIDGSEFTGEEELRLVYGSRWITLDDVRTYKNWQNREILKADPAYRLWAENLSLRHGFSIFRLRTHWLL